MGFGQINKTATSQLKSLIDYGEGYRVVYGNIIELTTPSKLSGWVRVSDEKHGIDFFVNGIEANEAFTINQQGKQVNFEYSGDITLFTQPIIIQMEMIKR
jgi:hypothetical protein